MNAPRRHRERGFEAVVWIVAWLGALATFPLQAEQPKLTTRLLWSDASTNLLGGPSIDGSLLSYVEPATGDLALYDVATGEKRALTANPANAETFAYFSVISRDSKQVAYAWFNEQGFYELWTVGVDGGAPRRLYSNPEAGFVQPCDWSLDGSEILTLFFRKDNVSQIALVSTEDGSVRTLRTLSWFYPKKISFSPDGRYILYDSLTGRGETARDILLLAADGSSERTLIEHPANDIFPVWTPTGDGVIFASDRTGDMDLWLAPVQDGAAAGEPVRIARSFGRALPMGMTRDGAYFYGLRAGRSDVFLCDFKEDRVGEPAPAGVRTLGRSFAPAWSPDAAQLAYLTEVGTENYGQQSRGLVIWRPETKQEKVLVPRLAYISQVRWSPDGSQLLAAGSDGRGRSGLFTVDPDTGETRGVVRELGGDPGGLEGVWLSAGSIAYVSVDGGRVVRRDLESREEHELFTAKPGERLRRLAATADGTRLAVGAGDDESTRRALVIDVESGEPMPLESPAGDLTALAWRGTTLYATVRGEGGRVATWRLSLKGEPPTKTSLAVGPGGPHFSARGDRIAYAKSDERSEVWALEGWQSATAAGSIPSTRSRAAELRRKAR